MASPVTKPLLILAFNRPAHVKRLIDSLRPHRPQKILVGIDGPREKNETDKQKIAQVLHEVSKIDWTTDVELRIREKNLGLRIAVADAVTWAIQRHGEAIVVEDDIVVGPEFLQFMSEMLDRFRDNEEIGHISGYNLVPESALSNPSAKFRYSLVPESYAWATWERSWQYYDENLVWPGRNGFHKLRNHLQNVVAASVWKINFYDANKGNINTWAYRWIATLWSKNLVCVSPNRNLISYTGAFDGTHTRRAPTHSELEISSIGSLTSVPAFKIDATADNWIHKKVFRSTHVGLLVRAAESLVLTLLRNLS